MFIYRYAYRLFKVSNRYAVITSHYRPTVAKCASQRKIDCFCCIVFCIEIEQEHKLNHSTWGFVAKKCWLGFIINLNKNDPGNRNIYFTNTTPL